MGQFAFSMASNVKLDRIGANREFDLISMYTNENDTEDDDSPSSI